MSTIHKELPLNEEVTLKITIKDYYILTEVSLIFQKIINDRTVESKYKIQEPYQRFTKLIEMCKKYGFESGRT